MQPHFVLEPTDPDEETCNKYRVSLRSTGEVLGITYLTKGVGWAAEHAGLTGKQDTVYGFKSERLAAEFMYWFKAPEQSDRTNPKDTPPGRSAPTYCRRTACCSPSNPTTVTSWSTPTPVEWEPASGTSSAATTGSTTSDWEPSPSAVPRHPRPDSGPSRHSTPRTSATPRSSRASRPAKTTSPSPTPRSARCFRRRTRPDPFPARAPDSSPLRSQDAQEPRRHPPVPGHPGQQLRHLRAKAPAGHTRAPGTQCGRRTGSGTRWSRPATRSGRSMATAPRTGCFDTGTVSTRRPHAASTESRNRVHEHT